MTVTIRDVARLADVSVATVSRVLNGKGPVLEETRKRVERVARNLRYTPHGAARSLITRRTSTVGVLLPDIHGEFFSEVIRGIDVAARRRGYHLLVSSSHSEKTETEAALRAMRGRVDGLIAMCPDIRAREVRRNVPVGLPVVLLNCFADGESVDSITIDNYGGAYETVRHLASLGHRRIVHVCGAARNHDARERLRGYRAGMSSFAGGPAKDLEVQGDFSDEAGYMAGRRLLALDRPPTAIFAANDSMAIGCLAALVEAGRRVPEDVALAGFDDIPVARFVTPPLTSVRVPMADLGERALDRLLHRVSRHNRLPRRHETLPTTLVVRSSCGGAFPATRSLRYRALSEKAERRVHA